MTTFLLLLIGFLIGEFHGRKTCQKKIRQHLYTQFMDCDCRKAAHDLYVLIGGRFKRNRYL